MAVNLLGIALNIVSIIVFGDYNVLMGDGYAIHEDWVGYWFAYDLAAARGVIPA